MKYGSHQLSAHHAQCNGVVLGLVRVSGALFSDSAVTDGNKHLHLLCLPQLLLLRLFFPILNPSLICARQLVHAGIMRACVYARCPSACRYT